MIDDLLGSRDEACGLLFRHTHRPVHEGVPPFRALFVGSPPRSGRGLVPGQRRPETLHALVRRRPRGHGLAHPGAQWIVNVAQLKREVDRGFDADLDRRLRDDKRGSPWLFSGADERARRFEQVWAAHRSEVEEGESLFGHRVRS